MRNFQRPNVRTLALLLLIPALALGPIGCGVETAIPAILAVATTAGVVAFTIYQFQQVESAQLNIEMQKLRLRGMQNGIPVTVEHTLSTAECNQIAASGKVSVNGQEVLVTRAE